MRTTTPYLSAFSSLTLEVRALLYRRVSASIECKGEDAVEALEGECELGPRIQKHNLLKRVDG